MKVAGLLASGKAGSSGSVTLLSSGLDVSWSRLSPYGSLLELSLYSVSLVTLSEREYVFLGSSKQSHRLIENTFLKKLWSLKLLLWPKAPNIMIGQAWIT